MSGDGKPDFISMDYDYDGKPDVIRAGETALLRTFAHPEP
jgi:hypothetical protein